MNMKKLIIYSLLTLVGFGFASCDFLDKLPDQRAEIDTQDKVRQLLSTAYTQGDYALLCELSSDQMIDNNAYRKLTEAAADEFHNEVFQWKDVVSNTAQDSPQYFWQSAYAAIAAANAALDAIEKLEAADPTIDMSAERAEAYLTRAYHHFILVNVFGQAYIDENQTDLGVPYAEKPETTVYGDYVRLTVPQVYAKIKTDLEEGLKYVNDGLYSVPKYHFNEKAANAFAARFYLYMRNYDKVIECANKVLGGSPEVALTLLRDAAFIKENTTYPDNELYEWINVDRNFTLFILPTYSNFTLMFFYPRYGVNGPAQEATFQSSGPNWDNRFPGFTGWSFGANYGALCAKAYYLFEYSDKIAGIGMYHRVRAEFTTNETLLCLAEALVYKGQTELARQYLEAWTKANTIQKPLTNVQIETMYSGSMDFVDDLSYASDMGNTQFNALTSLQKAMIRCILHFRRIETIHDGLRWFDIKRYGIEITHDIAKVGEVTLRWNDPRRAIQLPQDVITAGIEANPRETENAGTGMMVPSVDGPVEHMFVIPTHKFKKSEDLVSTTIK